MSILNALGITNEQFAKILEEHRNSYPVKYSEQALRRKLTDEEMKRVALDCEISERLNIGNTEILRKYGIEVSK